MKPRSSFCNYNEIFPVREIKTFIKKFIGQLIKKNGNKNVTHKIEKKYTYYYKLCITNALIISCTAFLL